MNRTRGDADLFLQRPKPNPQAKLRLFCFPYAGGGAQIYRTWANGFSSAVEICAIQLRGRGSRIRETPFTRLQPIVEELAHVLIPYLDLPFAFFGHSMGALIGFELARRLRSEHNILPSHLSVSGRAAPHIQKKQPPVYDLPEAEFIQELHRLNGTPREVLDNPELMQLIAPILRADFEVCGTYQYSPGPALDCPISAFGGLEDAEVGRHELEAWREHTTTLFRVRMFPGDHFFLHTSQQLLVETISSELNKIISNGAL